MPADRFGLSRRGRLRKGYWADVVVFSPERVHDGATFDQPLLPPAEVEAGFVNGRAAVLDGVLTGVRAGAVLSRP